MTALGARSLLFVAASDGGRIGKLARRGADLAVLDLEDAVATADKEYAREVLPAALEQLSAAGQAAAVRVNAEAPVLEKDVAAAVRPGLTAVMLPKTRSPQDVETVSAMISSREAALGLDPGGIGIIALIETPSALPALTAIAGNDRVVALALGTEDFSLALGVPPTIESLDLPARLLVLAAASHGRASYAVPFSLADFSDLAGFDHAAVKAHAFGATGGLCIHPAQVEIINRVFALPSKDVAESEAIIAAWNAAGQPGVMNYQGRMIDRPVILRAARLLRMMKGLTDDGEN